MAQLRGWKIATIRGVDVKIHFSLIFLLLYVVLVAVGQFSLVVEESGVNPAGISGSAGGWSLIFALALFVSVLLHEFAHVLVAQAMGVRVRGITLMMLGGVSEMEKIPEQRYAEFKVSVAGPLMSFALAAALFGLRSASGSDNVDLFGFWLGRVNLVLGIFNLFPAFPLDGGRALRSVLAVRQGPVRATQIAGSVAKGIAWALGILGVLSFNLLLLLIAFFIYSAASGEMLLLASRDLVKSVFARDIGVRTGFLTESDTLDVAARIMLDLGQTALPVLVPEGQAAVITAGAFRGVPQIHWASMSVGQLMTPVSRALESGESLEEALPELMAHGVLPWRESGRYAGIVRYRDLTDLMELRAIDPAYGVGGWDQSRRRAA